jgi:hypothetical protein
MDLISTVLSALLFAAFVPGVLLRLPQSGTRGTVLVVHAILFALVTTGVMWFYWTKVKGYPEQFANYGASCPNGYVPGTNQGGKPDCMPTGHATFDASMKMGSNSPATK